MKNRASLFGATVPDAPTKRQQRSDLQKTLSFRRSGDFAKVAIPPIKPAGSFKLSKVPSSVKNTASTVLEHHKLCRLRAVTLVPRNMPIPEYDFQIFIHFLSTWGQTDFITCSEIDFLTHDRMPIPNINVSLVNKYSKYYYDTTSNSQCCSKAVNEINENLDFLCNRELVKTPRECWKHNWPPAELPLQLCLSFSAAHPPEYIRIWNGKLDPSSHVKDFQVFFQKTKIYSGEVPCQFGIVASIKIYENSLIPNFNHLKSLFEPELDETDCDTYGNIPIYNVSKIQIDLLDTFSTGSGQIGLNSIQFFGSLGKEVTKSSLKGVGMSGATSLLSPIHLMKDRRRTMDEREMWIAEREKSDDSYKKVSYTVTLVRPTPIVMVRIWNYNGEDVDIGVKKAAISFNDQKVWVGVLKKAKGMTSKIVEGVTDIWFAEKEKWKEVQEIHSIQTTREPQDSQRNSIE